MRMSDVTVHSFQLNGFGQQNKIINSSRHSHASLFGPFRFVCEPVYARVSTHTHRLEWDIGDFDTILVLSRIHLTHPNLNASKGERERVLFIF